MATTNTQSGNNQSVIALESKANDIRALLKESPDNAGLKKQLQQIAMQLGKLRKADAKAKAVAEAKAFNDQATKVTDRIESQTVIEPKKVSIPFANDIQGLTKYVLSLIDKYGSITAIKAVRNDIMAELNTDFAGYKKILDSCKEVIKQSIVNKAEKCISQVFTYDNILKIAFDSLKQDEYYRQLASIAGVSAANVTTFVQDNYPYINDLTGAIMMRTKYICNTGKRIYTVIVSRPADKFTAPLAVAVLQKSFEVFAKNLKNSLLGQKQVANKYAESTLIYVHTAEINAEGVYVPDKKIKLDETVRKDFATKLTEGRLMPLSDINKDIRKMAKMAESENTDK